MPPPRSASRRPNGIRIVNNTIVNAPDMADTRGIALGRVDRAIVKWNHIANCEVAIQVGGAGEGGELRQAVDVSIDHNYLEDAYAMGTGIRVDAARTARLVHNVVEGVAEGIVVRGAPTRTEALTVANNLVVGVSTLAFALESPKAVRIFDYNVFSPAGGSVNVRYGGREVALSQLLKEGVMPHSKVAPEVRFANRDLARVEGAVTARTGDRGVGLHASRSGAGHRSGRAMRMRTVAARLFLLLGVLGLAWCATRPSSAPPAPAPAATPTPSRDSDNPEDVRARMPLRPTPFQHETKFPPPQQSAEEEERKSNRPAEPDLLHGEPAVLLNGQPFPARNPYDPKFPEARRMRYVSADAKSSGDGTSEHPWNDLQDALCRLEPGDRLLIASGIYAGSFRIAGKCRSGTAEAPIQVFARHAFLKAAEGGGDVLTIERAHWQLWEVQLALLDSDAAGLVTAGPEAHDIAVDQSHIYEGEGPAVVVRAGSDRITISNCHIHQSKGVRIETGTSRVTLRNNHIHHNRAASVTVGGGGAATPPGSSPWRATASTTTTVPP